ncbi:MAG: nucleotidyl transferase AbiEii/AbiGii toxin family protein [Candidatus Omnitrophota bacterium]
MKTKEMSEIKNLLETVRGKVGHFYLAGGTALSLFYFRHRSSEDLDFFSQEFRIGEVKEIIGLMEEFTGRKAKLAAEKNEPGQAMMQVFMVPVVSGKKVKVDFVQDFLKLLRELNDFNGISVLSLEDIYLRKIFAVSGSLLSADLVGRPMMEGGRQEAKDFFDLYFLSNTFIPLANFSREFCEPAQIEGLIHWFRTFDRLAMKTGILDIKARVKPDWRQMEKYFQKEIERLIEMEVDF